MAFPQSFLRVNMVWALPSLEVAQTGYALAPSSPLVSLDDATADAIAVRTGALWTAIKGAYSAGVVYQGCSVNWIGTNGRVLSRIDRFGSPTAGTSGNDPLPNEVATCASLRTAVAGRRTRGRMYLPNCVQSEVDSAARWKTVWCTLIADSVADLLAPLTVGAETFHAVVASATGGLLTPVTEVACGNVPDSQRRRRDRQIESYSVTPL